MISIFIVTTAPITLTGILSGQPKELSKYFDVSLISNPDKELQQVAKSESVRSFSLPMQRGISPIKDVISVINLVRLLRKHKPDVLHSYTPKAGLVTMLAGFIAGVPIRIHTFTGLIFPTSSGLQKNILIWMDRLICVCSTNVVPEGNGVKQDLYDYGITNKPLKVIGHGNIAGVDTSYFDKNLVETEAFLLRSKLSIPEVAFVFTFVGRLTKDKGFSELIEAFDSVHDNAHLLIVGAQDDRLPLTDDVANILKSHPRIHLTGWVNDVRPALAISQVLVLPSYREGFPNTPLQAGSMGVPSIVTDINGCNEIIEDGFNGWVIQPGSSEELYHAMNKSMQSDNLTQMGCRAREIIKQKFEKSTYIENLIQFYKGTIE
jgi:glycosyltransferase involved in cell wall biosynthesis